MNIKNFILGLILLGVAAFAIGIAIVFLSPQGEVTDWVLGLVAAAITMASGIVALPIALREERKTLKEDAFVVERTYPAYQLIASESTFLVLAREDDKMLCKGITSLSGGIDGHFFIIGAYADIAPVNLGTPHTLEYGPKGGIVFKKIEQPATAQ